MTNVQRVLLRGALLLAVSLFVGNHDLLAQISITTPSPLADGVVLKPYSQTLNSSGGSGMRTWSIVAGFGTLPPGLSFTTSTGPSGVIGGTPTTAGTYNFRVRFMSGSGSDEENFTIQISAALNIMTETAKELEAESLQPMA